MTLINHEIIDVKKEKIAILEAARKITSHEIGNV